ncbi:MAG TPA: hypothetical protein PLS70_01210 [Acidobacteriota bacterium]|nr:hypothetical protein [Acidobacteriota bacterium]
MTKETKQHPEPVSIEMIDLEAVMSEAVAHALLMHKRAGNAVPGWKDGKLFFVQPDEIPIEDPLQKKKRD